MKLLDAAEVTVRAGGNWEHGWDGEERGCGGVVVYLSECDPDETSDVVGDSSDLVASVVCPYRVIPFGVVATLVRNTRQSQEGDEEWLVKAVREGAEIPVARGLLLRQGRGAVKADTWIGSPDATEITAPALTDNVAIRTAVTEARAAFFAKTFALQPIFHVNPGNMLALKDAGVLQIDPVSGEDRTAWGDPVVISEGYQDFPDMTANPVGFFTGPIQITLSEVNREDLIRAARQNREMIQVTMLAAIDTAPCAMVRIGGAPEPVAP